MSRARTIADFGDGIADADLPAGSVLQVVKDNFFTKTAVSGTTSAVVFTGSEISLSSASNKVLVVAHLSLGFKNGGSVKIQYSTDSGSNWNDISTVDMGSTDNGSNMGSVSSLGVHINLDDSTGRNSTMQTSFAELISPNNTSFQYRLVAAGSLNSNYVITFNRRDFDSDWGGLSHIVVMETAG